MRSTRALVMIAFSILAGAAAVVLAMRWIGQQAVQTAQVAVASRDLDLGISLNPSMVEIVGWPKESVPAGSFSEPPKLDGRVLKTSVLKGEPIVEAKLAPLGSKGGLSSVIAEGKRAVTVRVNEIVGVAGFALPGNYVDVMVNTPDQKNQPISKIVLERVLVLAVAQQVKQDQTQPQVVNAVTLELTPEDTEKLDLARSVGGLTLVLRNQVDVKPSATDGAHKEDVLARTEKPAVIPVASAAPATAPAPVVKPKPRRVSSGAPSESRGKVEVIRGIQKSNAEW